MTDAQSPAFEIVRDARSSLMHVRDGRSGECFGCIEVGLYEIVRTSIIAETRWVGSDRQSGEFTKLDAQSAPLPTRLDGNQIGDVDGGG